MKKLLLIFGVLIFMVSFSNAQSNYVKVKTTRGTSSASSQLPLSKVYIKNTHSSKPIVVKYRLFDSDNSVCTYRKKLYPCDSNWDCSVMYYGTPRVEILDVEWGKKGVQPSGKLGKIGCN